MRVRIAAGAVLATLALAPLALGFILGPPGQYPVGPQPAAIGALDTNNDGQFDIVTANASRSGASVLRNRASSFVARTDFPWVGAARSLAVGDLNTDGFDDVVFANVTGGTVSLLLGNGTTLVPGGRLPAGPAPQAVTVDDLDDDGDLDLVVGNTGAGPHVSVLLGDGAGAFAPPVGYRAQTGTYSVVITDVDQDGVKDVVAANSASNTLAFLIGAGDGTFQEPALESVPVGSRPRWVAEAPSGLYVAGSDGVFLLTPEGESTNLIRGSGANWVGIDTLYSEDILATLPGLHRLAIRHGDTGQLTTHKVGTSPSAVAVADFNGDGLSDLAVANKASSTVTVFVLGGASDHCVVPRLGGKTVPTARKLLGAAKCKLGTVTRKHSRVRRGRIIAQRRPAGLSLPVGTKIGVVLSRGPRR